MKRDMETVRDLLLAIEQGEQLDTKGVLRILVEKHEWPGDKDVSEVIYNLGLLVDAGFVKGIEAHSMKSKNWLRLELTWEGHDFLDNTRDSEVWKKTKTGIEKVGGAGWEVIKGIAVAYAKQEAKARLGLDL